MCWVVSQGRNEMSKTVDLVYILDRSGSMVGLMNDAVGGFNTYVEGQKQVLGEAYLTLVAFDHEYKVIYDRVPLAQVKELSASDVQPRGTTALLDTIGTTIGKFQEDWNVAFTIMTDGYENASTEFSKEAIKTLVESRTTGGWQFSFVGAGVDNFADARAMGFQADSIMQTYADADGVAQYTRSFTSAATAYRTS